MKRPNLKKLQAACDDFNAKNPVGTRVRYYPVICGKEFRRTKTRSEAYVLSGHTACVFVEGVSGCVALEAVEIDREPRETA